jgi:hypothetical protein
VIDRQVVTLSPAILAGEFIANENLAPGQFDTGSWPSNHVHEADDRGRREYRRGAREPTLGSFEDFSLTADDQHKRPPDVANIQRFVILVQYKYGVIHPADILGSGLRG